MRRDEARERRNAGDGGGHRNERCGIVRLDVEEQRRHQPCQRERASQTSGQAEKREPETLPHDVAQHRGTLGAKRHADTDLTATLRHQVRQKAIRSDRREKQRQPCKTSKELGQQSRTTERLTEHRIHFAQLDDRQRRIGRIVFGNIKKYLTYLLSCNVGEIVLLAGSVIAGFPMPLTAVQILYVNLATDGLPALALAVDPPEQDLMRRRPRDARIGIFTRPVVVMLIAAGLWSAIVNATLFVWLLRAGRPLAEVMSMTFVSLVLIQFFNAYNCRSDRLSIFRAPFANRWLNIAISWEMLLLVVIIYVPFFQRAFGTFSLSGADWMLTTILAFTVVPVLEGLKWAARRGWFGELV